MSKELVVRFFAALEAGDVAALREIYAPDAVIDRRLPARRCYPSG